MVSPRKSRRKSACFSSTYTSTPIRASRKPNIIPAGPPPAMQQRVATFSSIWWMLQKASSKRLQFSSKEGSYDSEQTVHVHTRRDPFRIRGGRDSERSDHRIGGALTKLSTLRFINSLVP